MEKEIKTQSFRLSTTATEDFRHYCEENQLSQAEGFEALLKNAELEKAKSVLPGRKVEIDNIQSHLNAILSAYVNSLEIYTNATELANQNVADKLAKKDSQIAELEEEKSSMKSTLCDRDTKISDLEKVIADYVKKFEDLSVAHKITFNTLNDKDKIIASIEAENARFAAITNEYNVLREENANIIKKIEEYEKNILDLRHQIEASESRFKEEKNNHESIIYKLKLQYQFDLQTAINEKERAVFEARSECQEKYSELSAKYNKQAEELKKCYKDFIELKDKNRALKNDILTLQKNASTK